MKAREICELVGGSLVGDGGADIDSVADIRTARKGQLAFFEKDGEMPETAATCIIVGPKHDGSAVIGAEKPAGNCAVIVADLPKLAFSRAAAVLHPPKARPAETHPTAVIGEGAEVGESVFVGAFVVIGESSKIGEGTEIRAGAKIGDGVEIGRHCVIHPNVVIEDGSILGERVIIHAGTVVGADGFGYVREPGGNYIKFPQIGRVVIEDDVEIGANTRIDRGALGETRIGAGTKLDNLVQVGHNVSIGRRCVVAAQTGISGSVIIEDDCVLGGQVGVADHVKILQGAVVGAQAGIPTGKTIRQGVWWGTPARPLDEFKRQHAHLSGIGRQKDEIKRLNERLKTFEERGDTQK